MNSPFQLHQKTILVTGASSGIGKAISILLASQGGTIVLTARNKARLNQTLEELTAGKHEVYTADLSVEEELNALVQNLPELDGLVLNAGLVKTLPVRFIKKENLEEMFSLTVYSAALLIQLLIKNKKLKSGASICFISSVASRKFTLGNSMYSAAKGALNSFAQSVALELAPKQIRVNAVLPGYIHTNILSDSAISEEQLNLHLKNYPLGRFGQPEDVAGLVLFLMSDLSKWMTGSLLTIDGGYTLK
jgi:NAD(P)-dependent dehydrogenase (short-subunit alcohol dehydrogenase family)